MRSRLAPVVVTTVVIGLVLSGLALWVAQSPQERAEVRAADEVAAAYSARLDRYVTDTTDAIVKQRDKDSDGYPALLKAAERGVTRAPKPPTKGTTAYGREHSGSYRDLTGKRELSTGQFAALATYLRNRAMPDSSFIAAGKKLVLSTPGKLLEDTPVVTGDTLRDTVLPAYEKALRRLEKQRAPQQQDLLALDLTTYADDLITMTKEGAKKIDKGEAFFFRLGDRPSALFKRLAVLEASIQTDVSAQVDSLGSGQ